MTEIRLISDEESLRQAFGWSQDAPRWFRESEEPETVQQFLETAEKCLIYGLFDNAVPFAAIRLTPFADSVFSIDLFARRGVDLHIIAQAGESIQAYLFDKGVALGFFGWIPSFNRPVRKLYAALGFRFSGIACYRGKTHNRPVKWLLMVGENDGKEKDNAD